MQKAIYTTHDKNYARRLTAMLMLHRSARVSDVARTLCCARSSIRRWINWFTLSSVEGLKSLPAERSRRWPFEHICTLFRELIKHSPGYFGYQRSRWSTELLAIKINEITECQLHAGTVRRWLPLVGLVWRRAAPTLRTRNPHKAAIHKYCAENSRNISSEVRQRVFKLIEKDYSLKLNIIAAQSSINHLIIGNGRFGDKINMLCKGVSREVKNQTMDVIANQLADQFFQKHISPDVDIKQLRDDIPRYIMAASVISA
ncbi:helix-turn-helix domain-containing protein [Escherichia coli]